VQTIASDYPLRLWLGKRALETAAAKLAAMKAQFDDWASAGIAADYPGTKPYRTDQPDREDRP
jgi:hypothetical protein